MKRETEKILIMNKKAETVFSTHNIYKLLNHGNLINSHQYRNRRKRSWVSGHQRFEGYGGIRRHEMSVQRNNIIKRLRD